MFIEFTFVVNGYSLTKSTMSVTYTATNNALKLKPHIIQQLSVERSLLKEFVSGSKTIDDVKIEMRQHIINASPRAQNEWNTELDTRDEAMPETLTAMFGAEWPAVTESEVTGIGEVII
ncbi:MAG: hypothetical protein HRT93_03020 [Piscirickettsiaceae bacterium]|nr:hypothetical protein [Piscirickettsiaceae bacterium]